MIEKLPKISIVTPSFNQGEFLEECIDSVLSQNYPNLEYIIMDGGSSDDSVEIIKKYAKYLAYWQSAPDGGQYRAIEEGFRRCTGDIMAWLNSDDKYHHNAFFKVSYAFTTYGHLEWLVGRPTFWDKNGDVMRVSESLPVYGRERLLSRKYHVQFIQQESTFWRRSLWEKAGGRLRGDLDYAGDLELWVRFFRYTQLYTVDAILAGYRHHGNQKAALCMDRYLAEAEAVMAAEMKDTEASQAGYCSSAPAPLPIPPDEVAAFISASCSEPDLKTFRLYDESDKVAACLLRQIEAERAIRDTMRRSFSWRITKPLRWLAGSKLT